MIVRARHAATGSFEERWRYEFTYAGEGIGPGFHLMTVQQEFRPDESGQRARPAATQFTYELAADQIAAAALESAPKVAEVLTQIGQEGLQPNWSTAFDLENDGLLDFEQQYENKLAHQTPTGFTFELLPPRPPDVYANCRRAPNYYNLPRVLARLRSGAGDDTAYVVELRGETYSNVTYFSACNRNGQRLGSQTLTGLWGLNATTRLVDLNRDHRPDLVRVFAGGYRVLPNTSTADSFSFGALKEGTLSPSMTLDTAWVQDFNGDGIADLIARAGNSASNSSITVWFGKGSFEFESAGRTYPFYGANGTLMVTLKEYGITWVDANRDGLSDAVLTRASGNLSALFMNRGTHFERRSVPALDVIDYSYSKPVVADLRASGNTEITYTKAGNGYAVALDAPGTGLLRTADDGKGTVLRFTYGRAPAASGAGARQVVVDGLTVESSGNDTVRSDFVYAAPVVHTTGRFLLGFGRVTRAEPLGTETIDFLNEDRYAGVPLESSRSDVLVPGIESFASFGYDDATYRGIPWKRPRSEKRGWLTTAAPTTTVSQTTSYLFPSAPDSTDELCPSTVQRSGVSGTLTTATTYAPTPASFGAALACLPHSVVETGFDADGAVKFEHKTSIERNEVGLVTAVTSGAPDDSWRVQDISYTPEWRIETVGAPGQGTTRVTYAEGTGLPQMITTPEGVTVEAIARDSLTDFVTRLQTTRGSLVLDESFLADGQERLQDRWDSIGSGSAFNPDLRLTYRYATAATPASIRASVLVDSATMSVREGVDLLTAKGEPLGAATRVAEGWIIGGLTWRSPQTGWTQALARGPLAATQDPTATEYAQLFEGAEAVSSGQAGPFGAKAEARDRFHADVERRTSEALALNATGLVRTTRENGLFPTTVETDPEGNVLSRTDEAGTRWTFVRDALGRLREVRLPNGTGHRVVFDGHGRVRRVERDGSAAVEYVYEAGNGLLQQKRFLGASGTLRRTVVLGRDAFGRVTSETHRDTGTGALKTFRWFWDGATPEAPTAAGRAGLLTAVTGDGFVKRFTYRPDGKVETHTVELTGFRRTVTTLGYDEAGEPRSKTVEVFSGDTRVALSSRADAFDEFGRLESTALGGQAATYRYNAEGLLERATFANGNRLDFQRDSLTRNVVGTTQTTPWYTASTSTRMSTRGLVDWERYQVGATVRQRNFGYHPQRFLATAEDEGGDFEYGYDLSGLPTSIREGIAETALVRNGSTLTAWGVTRTFDDLGRTTKRGDLTLAYAPDGQLKQAQRGTRTWTFVHDEAGQRLAKLEGGAVTAAYVDGAYLDATQLVEPVKLGGRLAGVLRNGAFETVAADARGTVMADANGTPRLASPIGRRDVRPALSAAIDYVEKGYDADLGVVRMGVRDYEPDVYRFSTPDPLFLEDLTLCTDRLAECSLYGYARNLPNVNTDPSGQIVESPLDVMFIIYDLGSAAWHTGTGQYEKARIDLVATVIDLGCLATPGVTGGGAAYRALRASEEVGIKYLYAGTKEAGQAWVKVEQLAAHGKPIPTEGVYRFPDAAAAGAPFYVGQSENVPRRLGQHTAGGRYVPGTAEVAEVLGGKTSREIVEHNRIQEITGGVPARQSAAVTNKVDPIGPKRIELLKSH